MRAALDSVAELADLSRQDMYLGLRDVIPDEVWEPLWASYTSDLVREVKNDRQGSMDSRRGAKTLRTRAKSSPRLVKKPCHSPAALDSVPEAPELRTRAEEQWIRSIPELAHLCEQDKHSDSGAETLSRFPELRSRVQGPQESSLPHLDSRALNQPDYQSWDKTSHPGQCDEELQSNADTIRSEAETMVSDAMSHWLGNDAVSRTALSPFEIAHWLRTLPKDRLKEDTLKVVAKHVLDKNIDEAGFAAAIEAGIESFGLSDQRQGIVLQRYFKQKQNEAAMAEAAKQEGALNRKFNAKLEAKSWEA